MVAGQTPLVQQYLGAAERRSHCEGKGTGAVTEAPNSDKPGFVAVEPEHYSACFRLIRPEQPYYLTIEYEVLCADCALERVRSA